MIHFSLQNKKIHWNCSSEISYRLESRFQSAEKLLAAFQNSKTGITLPTQNLRLLSQHPLPHALVAYQHGYINAGRAETIAREIVQIDSKTLDFLLSGNQFILQLQCLLPDLETRGESIKIVDNYAFNQKKLEEYIILLVNCCGEEYRKFIGIVKTISIVKVSRMGELPYFSGADSDSWGAIHTTEPADEFVFAETLTHEAAHHWLFLEEEVAELAEDTWAGNSLWISPWRSDPRPIGGVIHGVFVFSCAALVLALLSEHCRDTAENETIDRVSKRICRLIAQVEMGIQEMEQCLKISDSGKDISHAAQRRLETIIPFINKKYLDSARDTVAREQKSKWEIYKHHVAPH
jgi:hypothetical protein